VEYACPAKDAIEAINPLVEGIVKAQVGNNANQFQAAANALYSVFLGDAVSVGLERLDDQMVGYAVIQSAKEKNIDAEAEKLEKAIAAVATADETTLSKSTYEEDGKKITRLTMMEHGKRPFGYWDFVQSGTLTYAAFSAKEMKFLSRFNGLKPSGEFSGLLHVEADMAAVVKMLEAMGKLEKDFPAALKEGNVTMDVTGDGKSLTVEFGAPIGVLGAVIKDVQKR
jgi:hypothetical protein